MKALFLDIDGVIQSYPGNPNKWMDFYDPRTGEIREYLYRHTEIDSFVLSPSTTVIFHTVSKVISFLYIRTSRMSKWHKPSKFSTAQTVRTLYPTF